MIAGAWILERSSPRQTRFYLRSADRSLDFGRIVGGGPLWHGCLGSLYSACFYAVMALLQTEKISAPDHHAAKALFEERFLDEGRFPEALAAVYRELYDAGLFVTYKNNFLSEQGETAEWIARAEEFVRRVQELAESSCEEVKGWESERVERPARSPADEKFWSDFRAMVERLRAQV
ncbi:MAG: HEPN domain-containing protein [Deltaproteobacteria bacterium]|nr:HEPN domain-containing protein [Deltaproteobacteria bacterium]